MSITLQLLNCNACGGPLDVHSTANFVTCSHCGSQLAVKRNETVAYTEVLKQVEQKIDHVEKKVDDIEYRSIATASFSFGSLSIEDSLVRIALAIAAVVAIGASVCIYIGKEPIQMLALPLLVCGFSALSLFLKSWAGSSR